ncbi:MAG: hypothetical protein KTM48_01965, partial [Wolbachia endosymbiont of Pissodes strobi]|nr:hypothetical protein [Wolbachia endosymbiont of Pissodes strobi]
TNRHNDVAKILHAEISLKYGCTEENPPYYKYTATPVLENNECKIYWDRDVLTDRTILHNRPDICVLDKKENTMLLIDIAIPAPSNVHKKHSEKIEKYLPLAQEIKEVWRVRDVRIIPIVIGSTGEIPTQLLDNLKILGLPGKIYVQMQKAVILATCNIMRKVLNIK